MIGGPVVALDADAIHRHLRTFKNSHFEVNRVSAYIDLYWVNTKKQVSIVLVQGTDIIPFLGIVVESFV